ncbi:MAG: 3-deoxy-8-phosphooctulonate synthase [Candidatus Omnitrophica bacterium]|nr:3-deoxy-8-phosphooctulonate synthase [Candidatus Omnitrophota bacterium]MDD5487608.1 3-deoxy-8-phosphooctulonate synthase [Candidatus Omnitrophota bacterium]
MAGRTSRTVKVGKIKIGGGNPIVLIAGPCVIESGSSVMRHAEKIKRIADKNGIPFIFKASYDKANRSSVSSYRGPGIEKGLRMLEKVKKETGVPVLSDVHSADEAVAAAEVLDVLQIPAFLCRQTDILVKAAATGRPVNVKKGQFMSPAEVSNIVAKVISTGNKDLILTERGTSFGYNMLVNDFRSLVIMRRTGYPVAYDATHSVQMPGGKGTSSGGDSSYVFPLSRAAVAVGCDALFVEVHESPAKALSDGPNMLNIGALDGYLKEMKKIERAVKGI